MPVKRLFIIVPLMFSVLAGIVSCYNKTLTFRELKVSVAPHVKGESFNLNDFKFDITGDPGSRYTLNIVIYSYKEGKETISMKGNSGFVTETGPAEIKAMLKIMDGERIIRAEFVEASGNTPDELILNLNKSVSQLAAD